MVEIWSLIIDGFLMLFPSFPMGNLFALAPFDTTKDGELQRRIWWHDDPAYLRVFRTWSEDLPFRLGWLS